MYQCTKCVLQIGFLAERKVGEYSPQTGSPQLQSSVFQPIAGAVLFSAMQVLRQTALITFSQSYGPHHAVDNNQVLLTVKIYGDFFCRKCI